MSAYYGDPESERVFIYDNKDAAEYIRADLVPQWMPIETAPKDGTEILVYGAKQDVAYLASYQYEGWWCAAPWDEGWTELLSTPTHWQPLPTPPPAT